MRLLILCSIVAVATVSTIQVGVAAESIRGGGCGSVAKSPNRNRGLRVVDVQRAAHGLAHLRNPKTGEFS